MNLHARSLIVSSLLALVPAAPSLAAMAEPPSAVATYFRLLVGRPNAAPGETSILVVPGTVVVPGESAEQQATTILKVIDQLMEAYRLGTVEPAGSAVVPLQPNETKDVPSVTGGPTLRATLLAADEKSATYRIAVTDNGKLLAEPVIRVQRGSRAVVGSRDGEAAPYLFLVVEPLPPPPGKPRNAVPGQAAPMSEPKLIKKVNPSYPDEAKKAKIEGIVLLECTLDTSGRVKSVKAIRGEPMGLTEAAIAAVSQWEYEPARLADGRPVEVLFTVTIRFALQ
jgi:TonB family protein